MHKQLLFDIEEKNGYFIKNDTGENLGSELKLYCYKSDESNIYLDRPVIEYPENYTLIRKDGKEYSVRKLLEKQGYYGKYYAVVSKHKNITSIEEIFIEECNSFYSIEVSRETKEILETIGLDNLKVDEKLFAYNLNRIKRKANGFEILFFVKTNKDYVKKILNEYKLKIIKQKIDMVENAYIEKGLYLLDNEGKTISIKPYSYTLKDKINLYESKDTQTLKKLEDNTIFLQTYSALLYQRISELINEDNFDINYLYYGYTDKYITEALSHGILQSK